MTSFDLKRSRLFRTSNFLEIFSSILNSKVLNFKTDLKSHDREAGFYKTYACEGQWPYLFVQNWASIFFENYRGTCEKCRVDNLRFIIGVSRSLSHGLSINRFGINFESIFDRYFCRTLSILWTRLWYFKTKI